MKTVETKSVHFWSRSRKKLWEKGETSGNRLQVKEMFLDCDHDTILVKARPMDQRIPIRRQDLLFFKDG